jgi:hypothetical protein
MPRLLNTRAIVGAVLIFACVWLLAAAGCSLNRRFNEQHAIGGMIAIREAEETFKSSNGRYGTLDELTASNLRVPTRMGYGYEFIIQPTATSYVAVAVPSGWKESSQSLYLDQSGIIRGMWKNGSTADVKDPPLRGKGINPSLTPLP